MNRKGASTWDAVLAIGTFLFLLAIGIKFIKTEQVIGGATLTRDRIGLIQTALTELMVDNVNYAENNQCYGWSDPACSSLSLTFQRVSPTAFRVRTWSSRVIDTLRNAGCRINGSFPVFTVSCYDGFGGEFRIESSVNEHNPTSQYVAPYLGRIYQLVLRDSKGFRYVITPTETVNYLLTQSDNKLYQIAGAVDRFVELQRTREVANVCGSSSGGVNDPAGGLGSWDDTVVPFVWETVSRNVALCSGVETSDGCGCRLFNNSSYWERNSSYCVLDNKSEMLRFLNNLRLSPSYLVDGLGNRIEVVPLSDRDGNPINCPPPRPRPNYPATVLGKTTIGVKDDSGRWIKTVTAVAN